MEVKEAYETLVLTLKTTRQGLTMSYRATLQEVNAALIREAMGGCKVRGLWCCGEADFGDIFGRVFSGNTVFGGDNIRGMVGPCSASTHYSSVPIGNDFRYISDQFEILLYSSKPGYGYTTEVLRFLSRILNHVW